MFNWQKVRNMHPKHPHPALSRPSWTAVQ
jgi:hypothetical protein